MLRKRRKAETVCIGERGPGGDGLHRREGQHFFRIQFAIRRLYQLQSSQSM